jgi:hypothetical protein
MSGYWATEPVRIKRKTMERKCFMLVIVYKWFLLLAILEYFGVMWLRNSLISRG